MVFIITCKAGNCYFGERIPELIGAWIVAKHGPPPSGDPLVRPPATICRKSARRLIRRSALVCARGSSGGSDPTYKKGPALRSKPPPGACSSPRLPPEFRGCGLTPQTSRPPPRTPQTRCSTRPARPSFAVVAHWEGTGQPSFRDNRASFCDNSPSFRDKVRLARTRRPHARDTALLDLWKAGAGRRRGRHDRHRTAPRDDVTGQFLRQLIRFPRQLLASAGQRPYNRGPSQKPGPDMGKVVAETGFLPA